MYTRSQQQKQQIGTYTEVILKSILLKCSAVIHIHRDDNGNHCTAVTNSALGATLNHRVMNSFQTQTLPLSPQEASMLQPTLTKESH